MKKQAKPVEQNKHREHLEHEAEGAVGGALAGAALGAIAGPPGAAVGAIVGGVAGAAAATAVDSGSEEKRAEDKELDGEVGLDGEMGAPNLKHPPARVGAYSTSSAGAGDGGSVPPAEGPIQPIDD